MGPSTGRIVVGLDDSPGGRAALAFALHDAARRGAIVEVVTAFDTAETLAALCGTAVASIGSTTAELRDAAGKEATVIVEEIRTQLEGELDHLPPVTVTAVGGAPTHTLLRAAQGADLLVVGSRGRGGFASTLLGSVSMQCMLHGRCPVTVVHAGPATAAASPVPA